MVIDCLEERDADADSEEESEALDVDQGLVRACEGLQSMSINGINRSMAINVNQCGYLQSMSINVNQWPSMSSNCHQW